MSNTKYTKGNRFVVASVYEIKEGKQTNAVQINLWEKEFPTGSVTLTNKQYLNIERIEVQIKNLEKETEYRFDDVKENQSKLNDTNKLLVENNELKMKIKKLEKEGTSEDICIFSGISNPNFRIFSFRFCLF